MVRSISFTSRIKHGRSFGDFLADRIVQAATEQTLLAVSERLAKLMDSDAGEMPEGTIAAFIQHAFSPDSPAVLAWLREYPRVAAMLCMLKQQDYLDTIQTIEITDAQSDGIAIPDAPHEVNLTITCLSPLAHGSDAKAGNATLYRRMQVLATNGNILSLPYYAGNALRGQMRDLLADDFVKALGLTPRRDKPPLALWFFHALYAGGALEENSAAEKALKKALGGNGAVKAQGIHKFRDTLPGLSLLGCALGNRVLCGRARFGDLRPVCKQWGNGTIEAGELFEWLYLTRREDHEGHTEHHGMIANTECLRAGTVLYGGIDMDMHSTPLEKAALGRGLQLMTEKGYLGAENRRGLGRVEIVMDGAPNPDPYTEFLTEQKDAILSYLTTLDAVSIEEEKANACDRPDISAYPGDDLPI